MKWTVKPVSENVHIVEATTTVRNDEWEAWVLDISDIHFDNPHCDRKLLKRHLDEALEKDAAVFINGDLFCLMQGKYDPRSRKADVLPQHQVDDYLDAVIEEAAEWFGPYAHLMTVVGRGNHEQNILKRMETDVLRRFTLRLSEKSGSRVDVGGYGGWLFWRFKRSKEDRVYNTVRMKYFHGSGGGGPVTKGVIKTNRMAVYLPDASIVTTGHVHEKWAVNITRERVTAQGRISLDSQLHICTGSYKEEYQDGHSGFHIESGRPPKPMGGFWIRFSAQRNTCGGGGGYTIKTQAMEAV